MKTTNARTSILFGALLLVAGYMVLWRPQANALDAATARRVAAEAAQVQAQAQLDAALAAPKDVAVDPSAAARLVAVPPTPELAAVLRNLDALAVQTGIELSTITPGEPADNADGIGASMKFTVTAGGTKEAAYGYLAGLKAFERLVVVDQVNITDQATQDASQPAGVQLELQLRAFVASATKPRLPASGLAGSAAPAAAAPGSVVAGSAAASAPAGSAGSAVTSPPASAPTKD